MIQKIKSILEFNLKHNFLLNKKIKEIENFYNSDNIEDLKNQQFQSFFKSVSKNPFYKNLYRDYGIDSSMIRTYEDLQILPTITKLDVKQNTNLIKQKTLLFKGYTSGTTGSPLVIYRDLKAIVNENAYVCWYRMQSGLLPNEKKVSIRGDLEKKELFYYDSVSKTLHISSFNLNENTFNEVFNKIKSFQPKALIGYPSSLATLATFVISNKKQIEIPLSFTSSETIYKHQEDLILGAFNSEIFDWYGNSERTISLYRHDKKYYEPLLYSINNYKSDCILTTSLINDAFPLVNYQVDDVVETSLNYSKTKKSIVIDKIHGRVENYLILSDGSKIGSAALSLIFKDIDLVNSQIVHIKKTNTINFNIVVGGTYKNNNNLKKRIREKLGDDMNIEINIITNDEIIYTTSGKYNLVITK